MRARLEEQDLDDWTPPPLDEETETALREMGATLPTGEFDSTWQPVGQRPQWLAFLLRLIRYRE